MTKSEKIGGTIGGLLKAFVAMVFAFEAGYETTGRLIAGLLGLAVLVLAAGGIVLACTRPSRQETN